MDVFVSCPLSLSRLTRIKAQIIETRIAETADKWCLTAKTKQSRSRNQKTLGRNHQTHLRTATNSAAGSIVETIERRERKKKKTCAPKKCLGIRNSTASSDRKTRTTLSDYDSRIPDLSGITCHKVLLLPLIQATEQAWQVIQAVKRHYSRAVDNFTSPLSNYATRYYAAVSAFTSKMVKNVKSCLKWCIIDLTDPRTVIGVLASFKLASDN